MSCENCGLPQGTHSDPGMEVEIVRHAENGFQRNRKVIVWVCCQECGVQAMYLSKYGGGSKAPITLAQFRSQLKRNSK